MVLAQGLLYLRGGNEELYSAGDLIQSGPMTLIFLLIL